MEKYVKDERTEFGASGTTVTGAESVLDPSGKIQPLFDQYLRIRAYDAQYRMPWIVFDRDEVKDFDEKSFAFPGRVQYTTHRVLHLEDMAICM